MTDHRLLHHDYPWTRPPLVIGGPMRLIALAPLAAAISLAGGFGFIGAGSDASSLSDILQETKERLKAGGAEVDGDVLPVGVGFLLWAGDRLLEDALPAIEKFRPAAVWLFAPNATDDLVRWTRDTRRVTAGRTRVWIQVGRVGDAVAVTRACRPDVLVVQGTDAGGHGLLKGAGLLPLFPEVDDAVRRLCHEEPDIPMPRLVGAGGIADGRGAAAALALGAEGVVMGTRYLLAPEATVAKGYREAVTAAADGGVNTARGRLYDTLRGTTDWPPEYGARGVLNGSWHDAAGGMSVEENQRLYDDALKKGDDGWGEDGRLATYAGAGVGLVKEAKGAAAITEEVRESARRVLQQAAGRV